VSPQSAYNGCMKLCEIYHVPYKDSFAWKWRHRPTHGRAIESKETYQLYYECVSAALERGYQPNIQCFAPGEGAGRHTQT
jgi:hypothetical protein